MTSLPTPSASFTKHSGETPHHIVIVGGGAGGLELATSLGSSLGRRGRATVTLIDKTRSHVWKPKLHEIAAGSMDPGQHEVGYLSHARRHHYIYRMGEMIGLDRERREVHVAAFVDGYGEEITPARKFRYDTLIIAVGSQSNDFGTPGVREHALKLESLQDARQFNRRLVNACFRAQSQSAPLRPEQLRIAIIGAGATGVELAAELHRTAREVLAQDLNSAQAMKDIQINLIEAADRILPALPVRISAAAQELLKRISVNILISAKVAEVGDKTVRLADGRIVNAEIIVWAAGVKAPEFLRNLGNLEANRINQLVLRPTLQTTLDDRIFAMGDCAACPRPEGSGSVPPRAQAAHQQASHLAVQIPRLLVGKPLQGYCYRDFGSLISFGEFSAVGNLMGGLVGGTLMIEGTFARLTYLSLYKMHELALHGFARVVLETLVRTLSRTTATRVKLH